MDETNASNGPRLRAGDAERERVVEQLREHHEAGRIDVEEFGQRMEAALSARYLDELPALTADLPGSDRDHWDRVPRGEEPRAPDEAHPWSGGRGRWPGGPWGRGPWGRRWPLPLLPLLVLAVVASAAAVVHGHFPFGLLWAGWLLLWLRPWRRMPDRAQR
jgi:uncharacterized protein DUF1707